MGMLANRLQRNLKHLGKWARRNDVTCFRVYAEDIPEYPLLIELYTSESEETWARVLASPRLAHPDAVAEVSAGLNLPASRVILKTRGERTQAEDNWQVVREGGHRLQVNLTAYHDTGLFLDHRQTRAMVGGLAAGRVVLNLFCYTGSFSVYAAAAGARLVTSVDLSNTYLEWAERNLELNGLDRQAHPLVRADVLSWLRLAEQWDQRFDLIVCDPPTFSNSKNMGGAFDVSQHHPDLLNDCLRLLHPGGLVFFSTNERGFRWQPERLAPCSWEEITASTLPEDFRKERVHRCFQLAR